MQVTKVEIFAVFLLCINVVKAGIFVCNEDRTKVIEFKEDSPYCNVYTQKNQVNAILDENIDKVLVVEDNVLNNVEVPCIREKYGFIFPGTLWCGQGTKATSYEELGEHSEEDKCCREHDNCPNSLTSGECKGGICNTSSYTRSHCGCDEKFQQCLKDAGTSAGNLIGSIFFNIVKVSCFKEENCGDLSRPSNESAAESCALKFEPTPKYRVTRIFTKDGRKLNLFERFLRKVRLL